MQPPVEHLDVPVFTLLLVACSSSLTPAALAAPVGTADLDGDGRLDEVRAGRDGVWVVRGAWPEHPLRLPLPLGVRPTGSASLVPDEDGDGHPEVRLPGRRAGRAVAVVYGTAGPSITVRSARETQ